VERRGPAVRYSSDNMGGRGELIKTPINLQDLRRKIYTKAKADAGWDRWSRRWLYAHLGLFDGYLVKRPPKALPTG